MACTPKHFVADGDSLRGGNGEAVDISETLLRETALVPFEAAVKEAHTASLMPAHHSLNGAPCHANTWLLTDVLRKEWGFDGMITSDALDIAKIHCFPGNPFYFARSYQHAGCLALEAGVDMELVCGNPWNSEMRTFGAQMVEAANAGKVSPAALDRAVGNVLRLKYQLGLFGQPISKSYDPLLLVAAPQQDIKDFDPWAVAIREGKEVWGGVPPAPRADVKEVLTDKAHERLALEAAQKTITLLKNQGNLLPLDKSKLKSVAVIGPNADAVVLGNYSGSPRYGVSVLQGLRNYLGNSVAVKYAKGCDLKTDHQDAIAEAVTAAQGADVSIMVVGTSIDTIRENLDRSDLNLSGAQEKLVEAVCATGKPVVVVLINGGALTIPWIAGHVPAILEGWYLGQEGGNAMAQVLFGEVNPGGKLPVTFPSEVGMVPCYYNQLPAGGPRVYFKNGGETGFKVQYPFGYGLSYTTFSFGAPQLSRPNMTVQDSAVLTVTVSNTGTRTGDEVAQLYLNHRYGSKVRPEKELKGFQRITLKPGESRKLEFAIGFEQMKCWRNGKWTVEPGEYRLTVGSDSASGQTLVLDVR
jgi:beta-glucosidase